MARAAYCAGERLYSDYDGEWKYPHSDAGRVIHSEILLPPNAPEEYADRQTLWNAVDAAEKQANAQTARSVIVALPQELTREQNLDLIREYCQRQFVDKGMICDLCIHDAGDGNPHAHLLLTMRAMDEDGRWLPKTRTAYVLDEHGERVMGKNGKPQRQRVNTVDWNEQSYCEVWRHEWEVMQNAALERAGQTERVDMRSFERQGADGCTPGADRAPGVHLGPAATAMERKGVKTHLGEQNRESKRINVVIAALQKTAKALGEWVEEIAEAVRRQRIVENPEEYSIGDVLIAYLDLRKAGRAEWSHRAQTNAGIRDAQAVVNAVEFLRTRNLTTVRDLGERLNQTGKRLHNLRALVRANEQRVRDIHAILEADKTLRELAPVLNEYNGIRWKSAKERYAAAHAGELEQIKKARRLHHKLNVAQPVDRKALKAEAKRLTAESEALRPETEAIQGELDELKTVRYWVRKVIPDALPTRTADGKPSAAEKLESAQNQSELQDLLDRSAREALHEQQKQERTEMRDERE